MALELSDDRRRALLHRLSGFFLDEFEQELSPFRAEQLLDFVLESLSPPVYNQAVQDARRLVLQLLDDLEGDVGESDGMRQSDRTCGSRPRPVALPLADGWP